MNPRFTGMFALRRKWLKHRFSHSCTPDNPRFEGPVPEPDFLEIPPQPLEAWPDALVSRFKCRQPTKAQRAWTHLRQGFRLGCQVDVRATSLTRRSATPAMECLSCNPATTCQIRRSDGARIHEFQQNKRAHLSVAPMFRSPSVLSRRFHIVVLYLPPRLWSSVNVTRRYPMWRILGRRSLKTSTFFCRRTPPS